MSTDIGMPPRRRGVLRISYMRDSPSMRRMGAFWHALDKVAQRRIRNPDVHCIRNADWATQAYIGVGASHVVTIHPAHR